MFEILSTGDIWMSAFLQTEANAKLVDIQYSMNGRETILFTFEGESLSKKAQEYNNNRAYANITQLRSRLNDLRDIIFQHRQKR